MLGKLILMYVQSPPSIKEHVGTLIADFFLAEFNIVMEVDAIGDLEYTEAKEEQAMNKGTENQGKEEPTNDKKKTGFFNRNKGNKKNNQGGTK